MPAISKFLSRRAEAEPPASQSFYLIVGLGNPGPQYAANRHNVGFQCVDELAARHGLSWRRSARFKCNLADGHIGRHRVLLVKPLTFMNDSGTAVGPLSHYYKVPPERILVVYDDLDLPLGRLRLRPGGSSGGHNGINSLIAHLNTQEFPRLRIGIGRPVYGDPIDYVLGDFDRDQDPVIRAAREQVDEIVNAFLSEGIREAMNRYNGRGD